MGLDMYLSAKKYLFQHDEKSKDAVVGKAIGYMVGTDFRVNEIRIEALYWRKANAIHAWFVKNCQDGTDNCDEYYVSRDKLKELRLECRRAMQGGVNNLEPQDGFFFGSTDKDEYYYDELKRTDEGITKLLNELIDPTWSFYYQSSW
jgi:hypothetical protein